jgi:fatty acid/phospholipid biosynthesis enzyme
MKLGLFDLFDQAIAEELGVDVKTYIGVIEGEDVTDEEQEIIIEGILGNDEAKRTEALALFNTKLK